MSIFLKGQIDLVPVFLNGQIRCQFFWRVRSGSNFSEGLYPDPDISDPVSIFWGRSDRSGASFSEGSDLDPIFLEGQIRIHFSGGSDPVLVFLKGQIRC